ncbi:MAG: hypothetical protein J6T87_06820, partial [Bacteroidales bacterium]|nr:hypothetical protein [Bacteroidales bacterium]
MIDFLLKTLLQDQYVFVERLGAFRIQLRHAAVEKNIIRPPYNEVVFSQNDSEENNFALANQISREKKCLFTEANEQIMKWVDELLAALQHNKSVTYEDFGTFMLDKKGNITFESAIIPQLNSPFEGMEPIDIKSVGVVAAEDEEPMAVVETEKEPESEPVVEPEPVAEPEPVMEPEPVAEPVGANNDSPAEEPMAVVEIVEEPEPEPVVESEPVVEPEPVPESVGANNDSPEDETMKGDEDEDEDDEDEDDEDEYDEDEDDEDEDD